MRLIAALGIEPRPTPVDGWPLPLAEISVVDGVHPVTGPAAVMQVSRIAIWRASIAGAVKQVSVPKAMKRPSALMTGFTEPIGAAGKTHWVPAALIDTSRVAGVQTAAAPTQVSRT